MVRWLRQARGVWCGPGGGRRPEPLPRPTRKIPIATANAPSAISSQPHQGTASLDLATVFDSGDTLILVVLLLAPGAVTVCVVVTVVVVGGCVVVVVEVCVVVSVVVVVLGDPFDGVVFAASVARTVTVQAAPVPTSSATAKLTARLRTALNDAGLRWNRSTVKLAVSAGRAPDASWRAPLVDRCAPPADSQPLIAAPMTGAHPSETPAPSSHSGDVDACALGDDQHVVSDGRELLRQLAASDERSLRRVLVPTPEFGRGRAVTVCALDRRTRVLVRLAALLAVGACTESLRWAVDLAAATGVDDDALVATLIAAGPAAGSAQLAASAPRLAVALGFDVEPEGDV